MTGIAIGLDLGTSGMRAALVDDEGAAVAIASVPIAAERRRSPDAWWDSARAVLAGLADQAPLAAVRAIAVCGTSGSIVPVAADGVPQGPASLYSDAAAPDEVARIAAASPDTSAARGGTSPLGRAMRWKGMPRLAWVLHEADWLAGRLLGTYGVSDWNNALKTGFDPVALAWPEWIAALGADLSRLPTPVAPGTVLGRIDALAAGAVGLAPDVAVVAGTTDGCAAFLATGAGSVGEGVTSLGTTLTLKQLSAVPVFAPAYGVYSHRIGDLWLAGGASNSGGGALARHFAPARIAALSAAIDGEAASPLDYYPLPAPGERFPLADGALASRETPRPADDAAFLHGLLEGIARIEALGYRRLAEHGGPALSSVFTVGGGAANAAWSRVRSRVLGVPLRPARSRDASVGVAGLAAKGTRG